MRAADVSWSPLSEFLFSIRIFACEWIGQIGLLDCSPWEVFGIVFCNLLCNGRFISWFNLEKFSVYIFACMVGSGPLKLYDQSMYVEGLCLICCALCIFDCDIMCNSWMHFTFCVHCMLMSHDHSLFKSEILFSDQANVSISMYCCQILHGSEVINVLINLRGILYVEKKKFIFISMICSFIEWLLLNDLWWYTFALHIWYYLPYFCEACTHWLCALYLGLLAVPSFSTLQSLRKSIIDHGNTCPLTQKHLVQLDWVSKEDGSHILTVGVGSKVCNLF